MIGISMVGSLLPAGLFALVCWVVYVFPARMKMADTNFLELTGFLFVSYRVETYWFCLAIWCRNLTVALVPVIPNVVAQIITFNILLFSMFFVVSKYNPWRATQANYLDMAIYFAVIGVNSIAVGFAKPDTSMLATLCVIFVVLALSGILLAGCYGLTKVCRKDRKRYEFFVSHHKAATGAFARLLKMMLLEVNHKVDVFLDSDNLMSLSSLFDTVAEDVEHLILVASAEFLKRPWCIGEVTIAHVRKVKTYPLHCTDFTRPDDKFIEKYMDYVTSMTPLTENAIALESVQDALRWFNGLPFISLPAKLLRDDLGKLLVNLVNHEMQDLASGVQKRSSIVPP